MNEDFVEFLKLVTVMRSSQKTYFRTRSYTALDESKILERRVDSEIARLVEYCQARVLIFPETRTETNGDVLNDKKI